MPIFDDPGRELRRLEEELLAEEEDYEKILSTVDDDEFLEDLSQYLDEEDTPVIRNHANNYGSRPVNYAVDFDRTVFADENVDEDDAVFEEDVRPTKKEKKQSKEKGAGGLVLIILLELAGIAALAVWWIQWFRGIL